MKIVISALVIVLMIGASSAQSVLANQANTKQEAGITSDAQGRPCTFGPSHDECKDTDLQGRPCTGIVGSSNYSDCVYAQGFKTGYDDATNGRYDKNAYDPDTTLAEGYFAGWHQGCLDSKRNDCTLEKIPGTTNYIDHYSGFKIGYSDGLNDGVYHHSTAEDNRTSSWTKGYFDGWEKGCVDSGKTQDNCDNQTDVSTP